MDYQRIKPKKIYEEVSDDIIERVKSGQLAPGNRLDSVEKLAKNYGVSRSAVREALSGLRMMGLVEMQQGEGTFITSFDASAFTLPAATALIMQRDDMKDLSAVRRILEIGTVGLAATHYLPEDLERLETALQLMKDAQGEGQLGEQADLDFHLAIAKASHNKMLMNLAASVSDIILESMRETRRLLFYTEEGISWLYEDHLRIYHAIKAQDVDLAEKEMQRHLNAVDNVLEAYLQ